jgi:anti-sigma factor RsiW
MEKDDKAARLWRRASEFRLDVPPGEPVDAMDLAAYLDGTMEASARQAFEQRLVVDDAALDTLIASRAALGHSEAVRAQVMAQARGLVAAPEPAVRPRASRSLAAWFADTFTGPWRPAVGAMAFGLYALLCLTSFELGRTDGLPRLAPEGPLVAQDGGLFEDDESFL